MNKNCDSSATEHFQFDFAVLYFSSLNGASPLNCGSALETEMMFGPKWRTTRCPQGWSSSNSSPYKPGVSDEQQPY